MKTNIEFIQKKIKIYKKEIFELMVESGKGHIPSSFSIADILGTLFFGDYINLTKENLSDLSRDRLIISKGHAAMALYPLFAERGFFSQEEMKNFAKKEGLLRLYADPSIPGIEVIAGSLGNGFGMACGLAMASKKDKRKNKIITIIGDGECYEGSIWESALFAAHYQLGQMLTIVDRNQLCIMGETENCLSLGNMQEKWKAFGWDAVNIDGHDVAALIDFFDRWFKGEFLRPTALIAHTVKGKGISFMENQALWHNQIPNAEEIKRARRELES